MKVSQIIKNHAWWITTIIGLIALFLLVRSLPSSAIALEPAPHVEAIATSYKPLITSPSEQPLTPLEAYIPLGTVSDIPYTSLGQPIPAAIARPAISAEHDYRQTTIKLADPGLRLTVDTIHVVKKGEILASIALEYGVTSESIRVLNKLAPSDPLRLGQKLQIPENPGIKSNYLHKVQTGDSLLSLAASYNSSVADIRQANPQITETLIVSQVVKIPVVFSLEATPEVPPTKEATRSHVVASGETLSQIANQYDVSIEILVAVNDMTNPNRLKVGTTLEIPATDNLSLGVPIILHEVKAGETLLGLVSRYGSSVKEVLYNNNDVVPGALETGQVVAIPIIFPPEKPKNTNRAEETPRPAGITELAEQMVSVLNEQRVAYNLSPLVLDEKLGMVAIEHAQDMVVRHYFGHVSPDGRTLRQRLRDHGFADDLKAGENIQMNSQPVDRTVNVAVDWLMSSPPHRKNILHRQYRHVGIGIVESNGLYTIVMDFSE